MPFLTVQCGKYFSFACCCFLASCSGVNLERSGSSTKPCQPVRSLPLKRAVNPGGGMLSLGPAFSSESAALTTNGKATAMTRTDNLFIFLLLRYEELVNSR